MTAEEMLAAYLNDTSDNLSHFFFDESKHKRDKNGRFAKKDGGSDSSKFKEPRKLTMDEWNAELASKKPTLASKLMDKLKKKGLVEDVPTKPKKTILEILEDAGFVSEERHVFSTADTDSFKDRINAAYKKASDATKNKPSATVRTLKGKMSDLLGKVDSAAKSGKDKASSMVSKGKTFLDKAFVTTTSYHTQAEKMGDKAKKGLTTVTTTFHTQAEKLKKKRKKGLTTTVYDTSSYKNL